jgi:hypothetical protein
MVALRAFVILCCFGVFAAPAMAADSSPYRGACLTKSEQRAAVAAHRAVPLGHAMKTLREKGHRAEVVRARLCRRGEGLAYVLTLLTHSGKVVRLTVDAANGELINGH